MKNLKTKLMKNGILLMICVLMMSLSINAQEQSRNKNNITLGGGVSTPIFTSEGTSDNYASSGSNFYVNYGREIYTGKKGYFTLDIKYINISNPYGMLDSDVKSINSSSPTSLGVWSATSDKFNMSSYLVGFGWNRYISKDERWIFFAKIYLGSGSLTSPTETFNSTSGYFIKANEIKSSSFVYSTYGGVSYNLSKNIALGVSLEYFKSSFYFQNQQITYSGGGSEIANPYTMNYINLNLNTELIFKF